MIIKMPEFKTFDTLSALNSFAEYWSENERIIQAAADQEEQRSGPQWIPRNEEEYGEHQCEREIARHLHDVIMTPMFRYSSVVMLYTILERELHRLVENLEKERGPQKLKIKDIRESSFLAQVAKFTERSSTWPFRSVHSIRLSAICRKFEIALFTVKESWTWSTKRTERISAN